MAALANDAHVDVPISTMEEFQAYVTVSKARSSYQATQYSASLQQAQAALQLKPNFLPALVGIGLSSGMLGQWDQAVSSLQAAKNLAKDDKAISNDLKWANSKAAKNLAKEYKATSDDLKWAKNGQKAAANLLKRALRMSRDDISEDTKEKAESLLKAMPMSRRSAP